MAKQTINGKAFEYACLQAIAEKLEKEGKPVKIDITGKAYQKAEQSWHDIGPGKQPLYKKAAETAEKMISGLEPQLVEGAGDLSLWIATDAAAIGKDGDVRDVLCLREDEGNWNLGISCKHNDDALKHPRITESKNFGEAWMGISCSDDFLNEITPIMDKIDSFGKETVLWKNVPRKFDDYYYPIVAAFLEEIKRLAKAHPEVPEKLLSYFFGSNDFYKVIMDERKRTTTIEGFNMHGTLNKPCGAKKPVVKVNKIKMPTKLIDADFYTKRDGTKSKVMLILTFDEGWAVSIRLHNKNKYVGTTSLAWDVRLVGLPPKTYVNTRGWDEV